MKKLLFLLLLLVNTVFFAQNIAPNPTYYSFWSCYQPSLGSSGETFLSNLTFPNGIDYATIDFNLTVPGNQNYYYGGGIEMASNTNGSLNINVNYIYSPILVEYTFSDSSGNLSTVGLITIMPVNLPSCGSSNPINASCESLASGGFTINYSRGFGPAPVPPFTIKLYKGSNLISSDTTTNLHFPVSGLTKGYYTFKINENACGAAENNVYVRETNPLTGIATATYVDFNANGIVDVGDILNCQFSYTNTSTSCIMQNVNSQQFYSNYSIAPILPSIPTIAPGQTLSSLPFSHIITQNDINNGTVSYHRNILSTSLDQFNTDSFIDLNFPLNISNGIKLNAFIDTNGNGIKNGLEQNYTNGTFGYQINSGVIHNVNTSTGVHYLYETNPSNNYTLSYNINNNNICGSQNIVSNPLINNVYVTNGSGITTYNFAITPVPCVDVSIDMYSLSPPRPGFNYSNIIRYTNNGAQNIASGSINFNISSEISTFYATDGGWPGISTTPNGFTYNFTNLLPNETRIITVTMQVPTIPTVSLGQQLTNSASITIPANDININNNNSSLTQTIVGSYDPNDKTESHGGRILRSSFTNNDYLTYTIQFENTGTANAVSVKVNDVLDAKLDETSIKMVVASHNYVLDRTGSNLEWKFAGIDLPPSVANTQIGHGYIVFQIKPKPGYVVGDIIPNIANIYFDFNPAIITNTCTTEFVAALANDNFVFNNLNIYPNPVNNILNIENNKIIDNLEISNVLGQTVLSQNNNNSKIDLTGLIGGIYFVKISSLGNEKIVKILKE